MIPRANIINNILVIAQGRDKRNIHQVQTLKQFLISFKLSFKFLPIRYPERRLNLCILIEILLSTEKYRIDSSIEILT